MRFQNTLLVVAITMMLVTACNGGEGTPTAPTYPTGKPTGITVQAGSESATIKWNAVAGAAGYYVYISEDGASFNKCWGQTILTTTFSVHNLTNGAIYYFGVSAVGSGGWESSIAYPGGSPTAIAVIPESDPPPIDPEEGVPPGAPGNLQGVAKDSGALLEWDWVDVSDFGYFNIYRSRDGGEFEMVKSDYHDIVYRDEDLTNTRIYTYFITAVDTEVPPLESDPSNKVTLAPKNFPPEQLQNAEVFVNPARITLEWDVPLEPDIDKYIFEKFFADEPLTGGDIIIRYELEKPTSEIPVEYAAGLLSIYLDIDRQRIVVLDEAVESGDTYTFYLSALDISGQEGPPINLDTEGNPVP